MKNMNNIVNINTKKEIKYIPIEKVIPNPYQARKFFNQDSLNDLTESIKKYGVLEPICVRYINGIYELIAGERRLIASKRAGILEMPAIVENISDIDCAYMSLIENIQRETLNFFEEAEGYQTLMVNFGFSQEEIAKLTGKKQSVICNKMRVLKLPNEIKKIIIENNICEYQAISLLKLNHQNLQKEVLEKIIKYNLNIFQTEQFINKTIKRVSGTTIKNTQKITGYFNDIKIFTNSIKSAVDIMQESGIDTNYSVEKMEDGYEIKIKVCM